MSRGLRMSPEAANAHQKRITGIARVSAQGKVGKMQTTNIPLKQSKYKNVKTEIDGLTFDSKKEAKRWQELKLLEAAGQIRELDRQVKFTLIPSQERADGTKERPVSYVADFVYDEAPNWFAVIEDAKGVRTADFIIKRKLMLWVHGITLREV